MSYNYNIGTLLLRAFLGFAMLLHGYAKLEYGISGVEAILVNNGFPKFISFGVYIGEIVAPILLIVGYRVKLSAFVMIVNMIFVIYLVHPADVFALTDHDGLALETIYFYIVSCILVMLFGSGKFALKKD